MLAKVNTHLYKNFMIATSSRLPLEFDIHKPHRKPKLCTTKQSRRIFELCCLPTSEMRMSFRERRNIQKMRNFHSLYPCHQAQDRIHRVGLATVDFNDFEVRVLATLTRKESML